MPPKSARKSTSGPRRGGGARGPRSRATSKAEEAADAVAYEVEERKAVVEEEEAHEQWQQEENKAQLDSDGNGVVGDVDEYEEEGKEASEEEDNNGKLELEYNEPEYEPEEEIAVDYDDKDLEHYERQEEEGDEAVEYAEEGNVVEEEAEMMDEELEDVADDVEGEEFENNEEEHDVDVAEEEHEVVKEHRKRKEFEVFVGGLDKDATEGDLRKIFGEVGEIKEVRLMMNPVTRKNKGFAFLRYATVEQARRCLKELRNPLVHGKPCGVAPSHDNDTLFVGNICQTWTKEQLKEKLKTYGVENYDDLVLVKDKNKEGMNRGYALLEFSTRPEAMDAFKCLQKRDVFFGLERAAKVAFADSYPEVDDEIMSKVRTAFIDGIPASWDEDRVKQYLRKYGAIEKVELARNMPAAKRKDFGFVTFDSHDNAVKCAEGINNSELGEGDNKVKVRARLSRPLQRPRMKHAVRGSYRIGSGGASRGSRFSYARPPPPRRLPPRAPRPSVSHVPPPVRSHAPKRPMDYRDRRRVISVPERARRLPPPERSYERRPPAPVYPKGSARREHGRRDEQPPPRSRAAADYSSRVPAERRTSFRDNYPPRASAYSDISPRSVSRTADRRAYADDSYGEKIERPAATYRDGRSREYDTLSGPKRPYADIDDAPHRYHDVSIRHSKARLDYDIGGSSDQYLDPYGERVARSHMGYGSSRALSGSDGMYSSRHGMSYGGDSVSSSGIGMYPSNFSSNYFPRGSDAGGSSYSIYSSRSLGSGSGYYGSSSSGPYY